MAIIGIDLGTLNSSVAVWKNKKPIIIPDQSGNFSIPSAILIKDRNKIFVGHQARKERDRLKLSPDSYEWHYIESVKRSIGKTKKIQNGTWTDYPQYVSAYILAELKQQAEDYLNEKITEAIIAIPSHFDINQRNATVEAAKMAGLKVLRLLNEATATALTYSYPRQENETVIICDIGGGTLDISVVDIQDVDIQDAETNRTLQVKYIKGDSMLGGVDFSDKIREFLNEKILKSTPNIILNQCQQELLEDEIETVKKMLSGAETAEIRLHGIKAHGTISIKIERHEFEKLWENLIERVSAHMKSSLEECSQRYNIDSLQSLLLVGGASRIPLIREKIANETHLKPTINVNIETCVAQGAAIQAGIISDKAEKFLLIDATPQNLGVEANGVMDVLIEANTAIPARGKKTYTTSVNDQTDIDIKVLQGPGGHPSENTLVANIRVGDIPRAPAGVQKIEVVFDINVNGLLHVTSKNLGTGIENTTQITPQFEIGEELIEIKQKELTIWAKNRKLEKMRL